MDRCVTQALTQYQATAASFLAAALPYSQGNP